jgi:mRNA interferase RelE/StbE
VEVRLTEPALNDLEALKRSNRNALRWALKKLLLLERDPEAGQPLHKELRGWRKLTVGDRDWRIVWRVTFDDTGAIVVDVAEVWAVGARSDGEVYEEMSARIAALPDSPRTEALREIAGRLESPTQGSEETTPTKEVPEWLVSDLTSGAGLSREAVAGMTWDEAMAAYAQWRSQAKSRE